MAWHIFEGGSSSDLTPSVSPNCSTLSTSASDEPSKVLEPPAELCMDLVRALEVASEPSEVQQRVAAILRHLDRAVAATADPPPAAERSDGAEDEPGPSAEDRAETLEEGRALVGALLEADVPARLAAHIDELSFEARKDATRLFAAILKAAYPLGKVPALVDYMQVHPRISECLLDGSGRDDVFYHYSQMLRSCTLYPELVAVLTTQGALHRLIDLACRQSFDISSEAFSSLRQLLLKHKTVSARYVAANFEGFFAGYHTLLHSDRDYVARRQALRLLGDVLLSGEFLQVMLTYIGNEQFLQIHMNLLREDSKTIQVDAFHVFKIFAANPNKAYRVLVILYRNRDRLLKLLEVLFGRRSEGGKPTTFDADVQAVMHVLRALEEPQRTPRAVTEAGLRQTTLGAPAARGPDTVSGPVAHGVVGAS